MVDEKSDADAKVNEKTASKNASLLTETKASHDLNASATPGAKNSVLGPTLWQVAPACFWSEAAQHLTFTRNILPRIQCTGPGGRFFYRSPSQDTGKT